jgi:hypothetical protein
MWKITTIILMLLVACKKQSSTPATSAPTTSSASNAVSIIQGSWELCTSSGGTDGDYKINYTISGTQLTLMEYYYNSHDGSCTTPIIQKRFEAFITLGKGGNVNDAIVPVDIKFMTKYKMTMLISNTDSLDKLLMCTGNSSPIVGQELDMTRNDVCFYDHITLQPVAVNQMHYTNVAVYTYPSSVTMSLSGAPAGANDGSTESLRTNSLTSIEYIKK